MSYFSLLHQSRRKTTTEANHPDKIQIHVCIKSYTYCRSTMQWNWRRTYASINYTPSHIRPPFHGAFVGGGGGEEDGLGRGRCHTVKGCMSGEAGGKSGEDGGIGRGEGGGGGIGR